MRAVSCSVDVPMLDLLDDLPPTSTFTSASSRHGTFSTSFSAHSQATQPRARSQVRRYHVRHDGAARGRKRVMNDSDTQAMMPVCKKVRRLAPFETTGWKRAGAETVGNAAVQEAVERAWKRARVDRKPAHVGGFYWGCEDYFVQDETRPWADGDIYAADDGVEEVVDCANDNDSGMGENERPAAECQAIVLENGDVLVRIVHADGTLQCIQVQKPPL
jgi:hypothetical protein